MYGLIKRRILQIVYVLHLGFVSIIGAAEDEPDLGLRCKIFNVGQGNGVVVKDETTGKSLVIDAGHSPPNQAAIDGIVASFSEFVGIAPQTLMCIVLSHPDLDHINVVTQFLSANLQALTDTPITIYLGGPLTEYLAKSPGRALLSAIHTLSSEHNDVERFKIFSLSHTNLTFAGINHYLVTTRADTAAAVVAAVRNKVPALEAACPLRPFFMNVRLPEFWDHDRDLCAIIVAANASHPEIQQDDLLQLKDFEAVVGMPGLDLADAARQNSNNNSAVVKISYKGKHMLFTGDIEGEGTQRILAAVHEANPYLKADILLASHHGSEAEDANHPLWVMRTQPRCVVVSAGDMEYVHPRFSTVFTVASVLRSYQYPHSPPHRFAFFDKGKGSLTSHNSIKGYLLSPPDEVVMTEEVRHRDNPYVRVTVTTQLPLYSTRTSETIRIRLPSDGALSLEPAVPAPPVIDLLPAAESAAAGAGAGGCQ